jgi:hypothetical protein
MNAVGWIGTEKVTKELTNCIFPGDGGSMKRSHAGCGCISTHPESCKEDGFDWCPEDSTPWDGVCAMHPDMLAEMLTQFKQRGFPYSEAVVDGQKWNDDVSNNIHAFVVPTGSMGACGPDTKCYTDFAIWYKSYKAQHGSKTILGFDVTNKNSPFEPFPQLTGICSTQTWTDSCGPGGYTCQAHLDFAMNSEHKSCSDALTEIHSQCSFCGRCGVADCGSAPPLLIV